MRNSFDLKESKKRNISTKRDGKSHHSTDDPVAETMKRSSKDKSEIDLDVNTSDEKSADKKIYSQLYGSNDDILFTQDSRICNFISFEIFGQYGDSIKSKICSNK